jgi:hypothetical protein
MADKTKKTNPKFLEKLEEKIKDADATADMGGPELDNIQNSSGPSGPGVTKTDNDSLFDNGYPEDIHTPKVKRRLKLEETKPGNSYLYHGDGGSLPPDPNGPIDKLVYKTNDRRVTEGKTKMSFLDRLNKRMVTAKKPVFFKDILAVIKQLYPDLKQQFPQPPTYTWNPQDEDAKLDAQTIKNRLKVKFPDIKWTPRVQDGVDVAEIEFEDESHVELLIGDNANHLTVIYYTT